MSMQEVEEVVKEIMGDSRFEGYQHFCGGGEASAGVAFQIGQFRCFALGIY